MSAYLFIDGGYLRESFEKQIHTFYGVTSEMHFPHISDYLTIGAERVYYYDAIDTTRHASESVDAFKSRVAAARARHDSISRWRGFHVRTGHVRQSSKKKNRKQKGVDVLLSVEALEHAARSNINKAVLLAGDLDFEPLLNSLVRLGIWTTLVYVPHRTSTKLMRAADEIKKLTLEHFYNMTPISFRQRFRSVKFQYHESPPDSAVFNVVREGTYKGRRLTLLKAVNASSPCLYVYPDDEYTKSSYLLQYEEIDKLPQAFELTFGPIQWQQSTTSV